jgi:hypothetical protein
MLLDFWRASPVLGRLGIYPRKKLKIVVKIFGYII